MLGNEHGDSFMCLSVTKLHVKKIANLIVSQKPLYILPQYLASLSQPIGMKKTICVWETHPCTNNIVYGRFGVVAIFLSVNINIFTVFVC